MDDCFQFAFVHVSVGVLVWECWCGNVGAGMLVWECWSGNVGLGMLWRVGAGLVTGGCTRSCVPTRETGGSFVVIFK